MKTKDVIQLLQGLAHNDDTEEDIRNKIKNSIQALQPYTPVVPEGAMVRVELNGYSENPEFVCEFYTVFNRVMTVAIDNNRYMRVLIVAK